MLTASASSFQDAGSAPEKALDGDGDTMWHSKWSIAKMPHWFMVRASQPVEINGVTVQGRKSGTNGRLNGYVVEVSDDGQTWEKVAEGTAANGKNLQNTAEPQVISFDRSVTTRNVKITWNSSYGDPANKNGSAAEVKLNAVPANPDTDTLDVLQKQAAGLLKSDFYTADSAAALQDAFAAAAGADRADAEAVNAAIAALRGALAGMKLKAPVVPDVPSEPGTPSEPSEPSEPGEPQPDVPNPVNPANPDSPAAPILDNPTAGAAAAVQGKAKNLAQTGASVLGVLVIAGVFTAAGAVLVARRRNTAREE
ncbi:discoidin domain-containing protein [Arcanobacterium hippocoleae]